MFFTSTSTKKLISGERERASYILYRYKKKCGTRVRLLYPTPAHENSNEIKKFRRRNCSPGLSSHWVDISRSSGLNYLTNRTLHILFNHWAITLKIDTLCPAPLK